MRLLYILRGSPASGKSTWIKENHLESYTLAADSIRLLYEAPVLNNMGNFCITQKNDTEVWALLMKLLEKRMSNGEFVIVDATHYKSTLINKYKNLVEKYRYRVNIVDFIDVPVEELLKRNAQREEYKRVPEETIKKMNAVFEQDKEVNARYEVLTREQAIEKLHGSLLFDFNKFEKVVVFGDIHGCYEPLKNYFEQNPFNEKYSYIFVGDYLDRGIQNKEVLEFLFSIKDKRNVLLLEGNHECLGKDTEILTDKGWLNIADVVNGKIKDFKPYSYNIQTSKIEIDECLVKHKKKQDKMIRISTNNTEQLVSFNHDVLLGNQKIQAKDLLKYSKKEIREISSLIKPAASSDNLGVDIQDDWLRLIVWVVCDGSLVDAHKNKPELAPKLRVQFKFSREDKIKALCALLKKLNLKYTIKEATMSGGNKKQPYVIRLYGDSMREVYRYFPNGKVFPQEFKFLSKEQLQIVLDTIAITDGSKENERYIFYSGNIENINILNESCIKNGFAMRSNKENKSGFGNTKSKICMITKNWTWIKCKNSIKVEEYNDYSYCITTKNGTLITRLNGKCAITGNCHLRKYAEDDYIKIDKEDRPILEKYCDKVFFRELQARTIRSREFLDKTVPEIESIDKKDLRQLCRKFAQFAYFTFKGKEYFICHGGIPIKPNIFVSTKELIKGTGGYTELDELYNAWNNNVKDCVLIHGHRNVFGIDTKVNENIYNLCSGIEIGEPLRVLEIGDTIEVKLIPNTVFDKNCHFDKTEQIDFKDIKSDNDIIDSLNKSKLIKKKLLNGGIVSYNFNRDVFYSRKWNELTCTARGLFVDLKTQKIIARSYNKFFLWGERKETESPSLKQNLNFPVKAYKKENGFLALISYNWNNDTLLVCSKSTNDGDYVGYINLQLEKRTQEEMEQLKEYLKSSGTTLVFECVDIINDPHIIKYNESCLYLLDEIKNSFLFEKTPFNQLQELAKRLNFKCKQLEYTFNTWEELYAFKKQQDSSYDTRHEGWVFEDIKGFMVKYKTRYYKFWKMMRAVKENIIKGATVKKTFTSEDEVRVYTLLRELGAEKLSKMSMIEIEDMYYEQKK